MQKEKCMASSIPPPVYRVIELSVRGMDCTECTEHVQHALAAVPGVESVEVFLSSEKAVLRLDSTQVTMEALHKTVEAAGYTVPAPDAALTDPASRLSSFTRPVLTFFGLLAGVVLLIVVAGEWFGLFERVTDVVSWPVGWALVLLAGAPLFWNVLRAALRRRVISHTLMSLGVFAALAVGQWPTAAVVVFFMHTGNFVESFTTERSRRALKHLTSLVPKTARVMHNDNEVEVPIGEVQVGDTVVVRPGEAIPVDGEVVSGQATIDQAAITGEAMPVEVGPGSQVFAATITRLGSVRLHATHIGADTTLSKVIKLVEEAEAHRADVQRLADRFSSYFLPVVAAVALLTFIISRNPLATASVLVVACSCSLALATPIAMLASIGMGAQRGLLIKGGKYLESLARADVLLIDKTGTVTLGRPQITDIVPLDEQTPDDLLRITASCERYSEHPLAQAVRREAVVRGLTLSEPVNFEAVPGHGVRAQIDGAQIAVGNTRIIPQGNSLPITRALHLQGKTLLFVTRDDILIGALAAADTLRPEVKTALSRVRSFGVKHIELLTGDNERAASHLADHLGINYHAQLLPQDKIAVVKQYQAQGHTVVMVGDGVNDAPALAQADIGIAMGVAGTDVAMDAAHLALMRDDWELVPDAFAIARRTMRVVRINIAFTVLYNLIGLGLAAFGMLPPIVAAAAQSLPDLGILANSAQLLRQLPPRTSSSK
jgi:Cu+-exporting ATPase